MDSVILLYCITGAPLPPQPTSQVLFGGKGITINWEEPFSHDGFSIVFYNLTVNNQTGHNIVSEMLPGDMLAFNISNPGNAVSTSCDTLHFIMTASNSLGVSDEGCNVGGYPIGMQDG